VEYNNEDQSSVTITVPGVQVRFNGRKAWIKLSKLYQNQQCGLCGHYDDNEENDLRMGDNEQTSNLEQFHRSFSVLDNEECSTGEQDSFYNTQKQKNAFRRVSSSSSEQQVEQRSQEEQDEEAEMTDDGWWGPSSKAWKRQDQQRQQQQGGQRRGQNIEPVKRTQVEEKRHEICFSAEPVKVCPQGTTPAEQGNSGSDYDSQEQQQGRQQQKQQGNNTRRVSFICVDRSSLEARRLQRQARRDGVADTSGQTPSFAKEVRVPSKCIRY